MRYLTAWGSVASRSALVVWVIKKAPKKQKSLQGTKIFFSKCIIYSKWGGEKGGGKRLATTSPSIH